MVPVAPGAEQVGLSQDDILVIATLLDVINRQFVPRLFETFLFGTSFINAVNRLGLTPKRDTLSPRGNMCIRPDVSMAVRAAPV
jgi:hypothetical protein